MLPLLKKLNDPAKPGWIIRYDDGTYWRADRYLIMQGRAAIKPELIYKLIAAGKLIQVASQMWSRNEIWRTAWEKESI